MHDRPTQFNRNMDDDHYINEHHTMSGAETASDNFGSSIGVGDVDLAISLRKPGSQSFPFFKIGHESRKASILKNNGGESSRVQAVSRGETPPDKFGSSKWFGDADLGMSSKRPSSQSFPFFKIGQERNKSSIFKSEGKPSGAETSSDNFGSSKMLENGDLAMSLKKPYSQSFPFFKIGHESRKSFIMKNEESIGVQALRSQDAHKNLIKASDVETSSRECHFLPEGVSQIPTEQVKYHMFFGESSYSCSRPFKEGSAQENFHFASKKPLQKANPIIMEQEPTYRSHSAAFVSEKNSKNFAKQEKGVMPPFIRQNNTSVLKVDPLASDHSPAFMEEQHKRMQKHFGKRFIPNETGEMTKSGMVHHGECPFQNVPHFVHDVETVRICTPLDSVEGLAGGVHKFSRTTHSLLITKQTDVNLYQENQFRESRVSPQLKGNSFSEHPHHFAHGQQGVKLQLLGGSSDHESTENVERNQLSIDTDAMNMEPLKKRNHLSGVSFSPSKKAKYEDRHGKHKVELPDMNLDLSGLPAPSTSMDIPEPCPSRTQSLDINTVLFNVDQTSNSKSNECSESNQGPEPGCRWIKRLKSTASNSHAIGTKSSSLNESSSHRKTSEPHSNPITLKKGESSSGEKKQEFEEISLAHSWIQRWTHNQGRKNVENGKPESSKMALEELQKKQFPSIAAMAMMGKAMSGFQRCKFQKKESYVVWDTKSFK